MQIVNFTPWPSLLGGVIIGLSAVMLLLVNGRIAGISGITKGILFESDRKEKLWRGLFVAGLISGGALVVFLKPELTAAPLNLSLPLMIFGGILVGFGAGMGNGCTSGHGVCGLGRRSPRSLVATLTFMATGFVSAYLLLHVIGA